MILRAAGWRQTTPGSEDHPSKSQVAEFHCGENRSRIAPPDCLSPAPPLGGDSWEQKKKSCFFNYLGA